MDEKLKSENMQKKSSFLCLCYILGADRCRERRYRSQIFFASGGKILRTFLWQGDSPVAAVTAVVDRQVVCLCYYCQHLPPPAAV